MNDDVGLPGEIPADLRVTTSRDENRLVRLELDDLREENRRLRASAQQMRIEIMALSRALEPLHRLHEALEIARASVDEKGLTPEGAAELAASQARADGLSRQLVATYRSTSWRLTRPVRVLSRLIRGQRGADWPAA